MKKKKSETLAVKVTKNHIRHGQRSDPSSCPIALAVTEHLYGEDPDVNINEVTVDADECTVSYTTTVHKTFKTPKAAAKFIEAFDHGKKVQPLTVTLRG